MACLIKSFAVSLRWWIRLDWLAQVRLIANDKVKRGWKSDLQRLVYLISWGQSQLPALKGGMG